MKVFFVEAKKKVNLGTEEIDFSVLPDNLFLAYSVQFRDFAERVRKHLGSKVKGFEQVLGCSVVKREFPILLVGSGQFHALNLALKGNKVYILEGSRIKELDNGEVGKIKAKRKAALSKFYASDKVGVLISTKPGQENLASALKLKKRLERDKEVFLFLANNIDLGDLENYPIDSWVNTSCSALTFDSRVVNFQDLRDWGG